MHDSFNAKCHYDFGTLLLHSADPRSTLSDYLLTLNANTLYAAVSSSQPFVKEGVLSSIETHFRSTAVKSRFWNDYLHLGNFLVFVRSLQNAAKAYKQATLFRKNCAVAYHNLSFVLSLLNRQKESHVARAHSNFIEEKLCAGDHLFCRSAAVRTSFNSRIREPRKKLFKRARIF